MVLPWAEWIEERVNQSKKAQCKCRRREPLEESRDGLVKSHCTFYFSAKWADLEKWIDDADTVNHLAVLHVFGEHLFATRTSCAMDYQCIPV